MAVPEAICFAEPVQLDGSLLRLTRAYLTPSLFPLWRYACLFAVSRFSLQGRAPRP
jgi:hypothetical protein